MKFNLKTIIVALLVIIAGLILIGIDLYIIKTESKVWISIGCSLLASAFVILLTAFLVDVKNIDPLDDWGMSKIYKTRALKNEDSDPELDKAKYVVDAVAFGLGTFRMQQTARVERCLKRGVNFRILTMDPNSKFVRQREAEENAAPNHIKKSINDLVEWADNFNRKNYRGKITIKSYNCMTLDFYWRVDNDVYVGPYWYKYGSQQTITFRFNDKGDAFKLYTEYFERLWDDQEMKTLTAPIS